MASSTAAKKEIIDFLWEWSDSHGDWGKMLVDLIIKTEAPLQQAERQSIFDNFLDSLRSIKQLPTLSFTKPTYSPTSKTIELNCLKNVTGVNKLAKNQSLTFSKNITVIYGQNGTGKTGYGRILKSLGFSYDTNNTIHHNILGVRQPKSAIVEYTVNGVSTSFHWNASAKSPDLTNLSVFNNHCVQASLEDRHLIVSPIGFHLFNLVSGELVELSSLLRNKVAAHPVSISWMDFLHSGTQQQKFMERLSKASTEQELLTLSTYSLGDEAELQKKQTELSSLNQELLRTQIRNLNTQNEELNNVLIRVRYAESILNTENWSKLKDLNSKIIELSLKTQKGIKEIVIGKGIEFYETREFNSFIAAADKYLKLLNKPDYPAQNEVCLYCRQPLESAARDLLLQYKILLNDKTQETLQQSILQQNTLIDSIKSIENNLTFTSPVFGLDDNEKAIQPLLIQQYNKIISTFKEKVVKNLIEEVPLFDLAYSEYVTFLELEMNRIMDLLVAKNTTLQGLAEAELQLKSESDELLDRKFLSTKMEEIKLVIQNMKIVSVLNSKVGEFNTASISRKTSEAREELVRLNFNLLFQKELKALRKGDIKIDLNFGTERGSSKITQRINAYGLADILSEGEQKAIALAEFLTELQLDNIKAPVIFDDPVNSLDHRIIDEVGKRLIELSKTRQVIIFTHSILLLNSLIQQSELDTSKQAGIRFLFHSVSKNSNETGIIGEVEEINSFSNYKKKLEKILESKPNGRTETSLAIEGYGHLRSAMEICVEESILKRTIIRYRKSVAFPALLRVEGSKLDQHKSDLNDIYEKCCVSIAGHSSPTEIHTDPTLQELRDDYDAFKSIRSHFTN
ncbi:MAG: AAA family ATPase [Bacteroidota bacterium]